VTSKNEGEVRGYPIYFVILYQQYKTRFKKECRNGAGRAI
jgi:hypothetical protein